MADWRQIQARIRKAKNSPDAAVKLSELFQRTRDAMVAWELGAAEEKAARNDEAVKWYTVAAQRFRRADWKKKAQDALTRLGAELPPAAEHAAEAHGATTFAAPEPQPMHEPVETPFEAAGEPSEEQAPTAAAEPAETSAASAASPGEGSKKKRRRGRRGGRGRRRKGAAAPALPSQAFAASAAAPGAPSPAQPQGRVRVPSPERFEPPEPATIEPPRAGRVELPEPQLPSERTAHGRAGDPALASRMAQLESMLRRLLGSALHRLDATDDAPAGPGVFLLSDSDQTAYYYIEACQTLRVGLANLARGGGRASKGRGGRGYSSSGLKAKLAEHLGISEAKVAPYLKDHCVVRWIQLDDEAPHLAHFAIGLLRTPLNAE